MSVRSDSSRIAELVRAVEELAAGQKQTLAELAGRVFGWDTERVFNAIHEGVRSGMIAKGGARLATVVKAPDRPSSLDGAMSAEAVARTVGVERP